MSPHRIMFVCHGNICRSPMAEFVMRDLAMKAGRANEFRIASCATTAEEIGNPVHPGTRRVLAAHGIACVGKTACQVRRDEYKSWDLFVAMDDENVRDLRRLFRGDPDGKVRKLLEFAGAGAGAAASGTGKGACGTGRGTDAKVAAGMAGRSESTPARDVADPWYTGDFETTWNDILAGCEGLLATLC